MSGVARRLASNWSNARGFFYDVPPRGLANLPVAVIAVTAIFWILAILPIRFGLPWSGISFVSGYPAILLTALLTSQLVGLAPLLSLPEAPAAKVGLRPYPCLTCEIFGEYTGNFAEMPGTVEAIYLEHLAREHEVEP